MNQYQYLKRWLSRQEIKKLREGENEKGICLSRQQVWNIMKGESKNFEFLDILVKRAQYNENLANLNSKS